MILCAFFSLRTWPCFPSEHIRLRAEKWASRKLRCWLTACMKKRHHASWLIALCWLRSRNGRLLKHLQVRPAHYTIVARSIHSLLDWTRPTGEMWDFLAVRSLQRQESGLCNYSRRLCTISLCGYKPFVPCCCGLRTRSLIQADSTQMNICSSLRFDSGPKARLSATASTVVIGALHASCTKNHRPIEVHYFLNGLEHNVCFKLRAQRARRHAAPEAMLCLLRYQPARTTDNERKRSGGRHGGKGVPSQPLGFRQRCADSAYAGSSGRR